MSLEEPSSHDGKSQLTKKQVALPDETTKPTIKLTGDASACSLLTCKEIEVEHGLASEKPEIHSVEDVENQLDEISKNAVINFLCVLCIIQGADEQLLPSSFRALEQQLGLTTSELAILSACQGGAMAISGPFWGSLADSGVPRRWLLAAGSISWGVLTVSLAFVVDVRHMILLRLLNGAALGMLAPIVQSLVAEVCSKSERGMCFGMLAFHRVLLGQALSAIIITSLSNQYVWGHAGWCACFISLGIISVVVGVSVFFFMPEKTRPWALSEMGVLAEGHKIVHFFRIPTFGVIVAQGLFGTIPWAAQAFMTLFFQYVGMKDSIASLVYSMNVIGHGLGGWLGGWIGDRLSMISPFHGRIITAQVSVLLGIPMVAAIFGGIPQSPDNALIYAICVFILGLSCSWCGTGCNKPIVMDIVPASRRASVFAWEACIESLSGSCFGPLSVAILTHLYHYQLRREPVSRMTEEERNTNANALGEALIISNVVPWCICFCLYTFLHATYKYDIVQESEGARLHD